MFPSSLIKTGSLCPISCSQIEAISKYISSSVKNNQEAEQTTGHMDLRDSGSERECDQSFEGSAFQPIYDPKP